MEIEGTSGSLCVKASSVWSDERPDMGGGCGDCGHSFELSVRNQVTGLWSFLRGLCPGGAVVEGQCSI